MKKFRTALIGTVNRNEFAEIAARIRKNSQSVLFADFFEFDKWITKSGTSGAKGLPILDLIIVFQSYSGEFSVGGSRKLWERIRKTYPLTPTVAVLGSWCEGELRTGFPLSASHRIYANDWFTQGEKEFFALKNGDFSIWSLPTTFQDEEMILEKFLRRPLKIPQNILEKKPKKKQSEKKQSAWVFSCRTLSFPDSEMERLLHAILNRFGFESSSVGYGEWDMGDGDSNSNPSPILHPLFPIPNLIVWDLGEIGPKNVEQMKKVLQELRSKTPDAQIVLLTDSPRIEELQSFYANGATRILSKPFYDVEAIVGTVSSKCVGFGR